MVSFDSPKGIILDLDSATQVAACEGSNIGTKPYQAPEVVAWDDGMGHAYDKGIDIWTLGLCMFDMYKVEFLLWHRLPPRELPPRDGRPLDNVVKNFRHCRFEDALTSMEDGCAGDKIATSFVSSIREMTQCFAVDRSSASALLKFPSPLTPDLGRGTIVSRKVGTKRTRSVWSIGD